MDSKYAVKNKSVQKNNNPIYLKNVLPINVFSIKRKLQNPENGAAKVPKTQTVPAKADQTAVNALQLQQQRKQLPVYKCRQQIVQEIRKSDTLLIMGETGSGKTTQIPQFLLAAGFGETGIIGVTQPRRVAAITVSKRVAQEQNSPMGETVGYTVRFEDCTSAQTRIRYLTDGSLLREALADRLLRNYSVLMLDEVHERTVNTDVLFGIVKEAQKQRRNRNQPPLKIIVTSATMDIDHFGKYFCVRGMYLEGRMHPVRILHAKETQPDYLNAALVTIFDIHRSTPISHDVLVFLTGQEEIEALAQQIRLIAKTNFLNGPNIRVFPLYAQLPQNKQLECFLPMPGNVRKVILATNVAETSITISGIRCVIDCGFVKRRIYNANSGLDVLRVIRISQAQAWQRSGRAGRESPGVCYRTYTQTEMSSFDSMPTPEILRSNIVATVLQLLALGIDSRSFDFLDSPPTESIDSAFRSLGMLGAVTVANTTTPQLTSNGRKMAQFPLDPKYSKLLLSASAFSCMEEMLSIVAMLSSENVFIQSTDKRELAALAHAKFNSKHGDHLTLLNVYNAFKKTDKVKAWCHDNFLNARNLQYAREVRNQLLKIVERFDLEVNNSGNNYEQIAKCLLAGLFENIAELHRDNMYITVSGRQRANIHPSSVFHRKYRPEYVIFTEMVLTDRNFIRQITEIRPEWIGEVVPNYAHLSKIKV